MLFQYPRPDSFLTDSTTYIRRRMKKKKILAGVLAAAMAMTTLAGCGAGAAGVERLRHRGSGVVATGDDDEAFRRGPEPCCEAA